VKLLVLCGLIGTWLGAGQASAVTINFDNLADKTTVTNQYAGVTFSSAGGDVVLISSQNPPYTGTAPNVICTGVALPIGTVDCSHDLILNFSTPVNNLTFDAFGNQSTVGTQFAEADVYQNGVLTQPNVSMIVTHFSHTQGCPGLPNTIPDCLPDPQDFTAYAGITQLIIHNNTDTQGTAYDNFSFIPTSDPEDLPIGTPEPATWLLTGLGGFVWAGRRFLTRKSV
jgi:hypothetical protein